MPTYEWRPELIRRLDGLNLRPEREAEIVDELSQHLEDQVRDLIAGGATMDDARRTALADLDAPGVLATRLHEILDRPPLRLPPPGTPARGRWLRARWQDLRYSLRSLRRSPAFTATVIVTLGLTIGPTTALLSVGNWLLWRPPTGVIDPDRLGLARFETPTSQGVTIRPMSYLNLDDLRRGSTQLTSIAGLIESSVNLAISGVPPEEAPAAYVTGDFFDTLGIRAALGRTFQPDDDQWPNGAHVVVVGDGLARRAFGSPADALGKTVLLYGRPMTIVGVLPRGFSGVAPLSRTAIWIPGAAFGYVNHYTAPMPVVRGEGPFTSFIVRLASGATFATAQAEVDGLVASLARQYADDNKNLAQVRTNLTPGISFRPEMRQRYAEFVGTLMTIGSVLLLLGCANVANLMMARGIRGQRERSVRLALGASRGRLVLLHLTESLLLACGGALAGVALAFALKQYVAALVIPVVATRPDILVPMDLRVLSMTLGISVACGLAAGLVPSLVGARTLSINFAGSAGRRTVVWRRRLRGSLAVAQLALSLALVTGALLLVATLRNLLAIDPGFDASGVSVHQLDAGRQGYTPERTRAYYRDVFQRLQGAPGAIAVSLSATAWGSNREIRVLDPAGTSGLVLVRANAVTRSFFDVLGIRVVAGRAFTDDEVLVEPAASLPLVMINETLARRLFGAERSPVGRQIVIPPVGKDPQRDLTVIGVTRDARWRVAIDPPLEMYLPFTNPAYRLNSVTLMVKSGDSVPAVTERVKTAAMAVDATLPVRVSVAFNSELKYQLSDRTTFAWVLSMLGWLGLVLATVGLYGLLAQAVAERTKEFGIRMAVGSGRARIFKLVMRQAAWIGGLGVVIGVGLAVAGSRLIEAQLYGVTPTSAGVYATAASVLLAAVFLAGLWPARTATRIQPVEALRTE